MKRLSFTSKTDWLKNRKLGGSDASVILNLNPYKSITDLYLEKIGVKKSPNLSKNKSVQKGNRLEPTVRELFAVSFPQYVIYYNDWEILVHEEHDFIRASVDGELSGPEGLGIHEIKTATPRGADAWDLWKDRIPDMYYCQILHYFIVTGYQYAILTAYLMHEAFREGELPSAELRHYRFERKDCVEDIGLLLNAEIKFWTEHIIPKNMPDTIIRL
jgi:putative phage-type endonuclease